VFSRLPAHRRDETKEKKELLLLTAIDAGSSSDLILFINLRKTHKQARCIRRNNMKQSVGVYSTLV